MDSLSSQMPPPPQCLVMCAPLRHVFTEKRPLRRASVRRRATVIIECGQKRSYSFTRSEVQVWCSAPYCVRSNG